MYHLMMLQSNWKMNELIKSYCIKVSYEERDDDSKTKINENHENFTKVVFRN